MCGYKLVQIPTDARGGMDIEALRKAINPKTAGLMLTNPNTLGLFDENIVEIAEMVHAAGGLLYYDGANANAIVGRSRPGDMGFDIVHFNLHKTFSTPHGGGGPGAGPVVVRERFGTVFACARIVAEGDKFRFDWGDLDTVGRLHAFYGNFGVLVRAYTYIRRLVRKVCCASVSMPCSTPTI